MTNDELQSRYNAWANAEIRRQAEAKSDADDQRTRDAEMFALMAGLRHIIRGKPDLLGIYDPELAAACLVANRASITVRR